MKATKTITPRKFSLGKATWISLGVTTLVIILMAKQGDGKMRFITPQETVTNGAQIN